MPTNIAHRNHIVKSGDNSSANGVFLDTLAQLRNSPPSDEPKTDKNALLKRAQSKYISNQLALQLADLGNERKQSYYNTFHCASVMVQHDEKITTTYCNNRWCLTCNRIRTAKMINGYKAPLIELQEKQFVTLTIVSVTAEDLRPTIKQMIKTFQTIKDKLRKQKIKIKGIRKMECTYSERLNKFHPHFHLIIDGDIEAAAIVNEWLKSYPDANRGGQSIILADDNTTMELFKYFTKLTTNKQFHVEALDVMFDAMYRLRVFQPFGIKKDVSEDVDDIEAMVYDIDSSDEVWIWEETDWVNHATGELLTGYTPSETVEKMVLQINSS